MSGYNLFMAPLERLYLRQIRQELMPKAYGKVLEIGFGGGVNMKYYDFEKIESLHALDIKENMKKYPEVVYHVSNAENLPFEDESFDTVVLTLALCTIADQGKVLKEIKRILKKGGIYIFLEHEKPKSKFFSGLVNTINPLWKRVARGCQLNRESHKAIQREGFQVSLNNKNVFYYGLAKNQ